MVHEDRAMPQDQVGDGAKFVPRDWVSAFLDQSSALPPTTLQASQVPYEAPTFVTAPASSKFVHFEPAAPTDREWENLLGDERAYEPGLDDFDNDALYHFGGEQRVQSDPRIGVGDLEGWSDMRRDWENFEREQGLRDGNAQYMFQRQNPVVSEATGRTAAQVSFRGTLCADL